MPFSKKSFESARELVKPAPEEHVRILMESLNPQLFKKAHDKDIKICPWTVNTKEEITKF